MNRNVPIEVKKSTFMKVDEIQQNESSMVYNIYNIVFFYYEWFLYFFFFNWNCFFFLFNFIILPKVNTSRAIQQVPETKTISDFIEPQPPPKICDVLRDVLREPITGKIYKTVKGQVKNHSTLTKQGKCWSVTALITDCTSSVEVCFDSEVRVK